MRDLHQRQGRRWSPAPSVAVSLALSLAMIAASAAVTAPRVLAVGSVSLATIGAAYSQDFDTLASVGTASTVPLGWEFSESGTNANMTYTAGNGSSNTGDTYSFGATGSGERAFGGLLSNALAPRVGAQFTNNTGGPITSLDVAYTGEQWRLGQVTTGRAADRLDFGLSTDASSLTTGTWADVNALDFSSPVVAGTVGALDGNGAANRTALSFSITGLSIANGASFWIRWLDSDLTPGADDGLAVDEFSITPRLDGPDLAIAKRHDGTPIQGQASLEYLLVVENVGSQPTSGPATVVDALPAGLTATSLSGRGWNCSLATLTCTRADELGPGKSYPPIRLTVTLAVDAPSSVTNTATVSGGDDVNTANNTASDPTPIIGVGPRPACAEQPATIWVALGRIIGGPSGGNEYGGVLTGTPGDDVIVGSMGSDVVSGGEGADRICLLAGWDVADGGPGADRIEGGPGVDVLSGGPGNDRLTGGLGPDVFNGGDGTDTATDFHRFEGDTRTGVEHY